MLNPNFEAINILTSNELAKPRAFKTEILPEFRIVCPFDSCKFPELIEGLFNMKISFLDFNSLLKDLLRKSIDVPSNRR